MASSPGVQLHASGLTPSRRPASVRRTAWPHRDRGSRRSTDRGFDSTRAQLPSASRASSASPTPHRHAAHDAAVLVLQDRVAARDRRQRAHRFQRTRQPAQAQASCCSRRASAACGRSANAASRSRSRASRRRGCIARSTASAWRRRARRCSSWRRQRRMQAAHALPPGAGTAAASRACGRSACRRSAARSARCIALAQALRAAARAAGAAVHAAQAPAGRRGSAPAVRPRPTASARAGRRRNRRG